MKNITNTFDIKDLNFTYASAEQRALNDIDLKVSYGEFVTLCGKTGSGKSTLLRNFKPVLSPEGLKSGSVEFYGRDINKISDEEQARRIGFVLQDPDNQIVTDKVWHELAFGLENLGTETNAIRIRVAEMATFFGISPWIHKDITQLSGGQKQLLNLASVMTMNPDVLILDEPTSFLDPVASEEFIDTLTRINKEIGTTVIISEHDLNKVMPASDRVIVMEAGEIIADDIPEKIRDLVSAKDNDFILSMPIPLQVYMRLQSNLEENIGIIDSHEKNLYEKNASKQMNPLTIREGRDWLTGILQNVELKETVATDTKHKTNESIIQLKDVRFKYDKNGDDIIKNLNLEIPRGLITTIAGGNGSGKSTLMKIISGIRKPYRGKICSSDKKIVLLPQKPQSLFIKENVKDELYDVLTNSPYSKIDAPSKIHDVIEIMDLSNFLDRHPYDLSGGEQQRVAFAKILLTDGDVYLLDEPTTGLDGANKKVLGDILSSLKSDGKTIVAVTHDLQFAAEYSDLCLLLFDGQIMSSGTPKSFFSGNSFYTTGANRMSRHIFEQAVTPDDIVQLCMENLK